METPTFSFSFFEWNSVLYQQESEDEDWYRGHRGSSLKIIMSSFENSPYRRRRTDIEVGSSRFTDDFDDDDEGNPFDIIGVKNAPIERLKRWRVCLL